VVLSFETRPTSGRVIVALCIHGWAGSSEDQRLSSTNRVKALISHLEIDE